MENRGYKFSLWQPLVLAVIFLTGLIIFEMVFLSQNYEKFALGEHYKHGIYRRVFAIILLTLVSFFLTAFFCWAAFGSPYKFRIVYFFLFCLAIFIEYGYQNAFARFTDFEDLENILVAANWRIRFDAAAMYLNALAVIPCLAFGAFLLFAKPTIKKGWSALLVSLLLFSGSFSLTAYFTNNVFTTVSLSAFYRTIVDFPMAWYVGSVYQPPRRIFYNEQRQEVGFRSENFPTNNIVFIVDESVRGDHLSLNGYSRPTTPFLDELSKNGFINNWGLAVSGTTCSMTANNLLLTGLNELPDPDFKIYKLPTIFQYAKAMGYKTFYFDGQVSNVWNGKPSDISAIDERITVENFQDKKLFEIDAEIALRVKNLTGKSAGNFIWISKFGVHKPYRHSYPKSETLWSPVPSDDDSRGYYNSDISRETIVNDYDNAVRFNSQIFFTNLINENPAENTIYVYTSDHGQTLGENGAVASHCSNTKSEATVPLLIIGETNSLPVLDTNFKASHLNIFATLLDLMNFPEEERRYPYSSSLLKAKSSDSQPRFFFYGNLHGRGIGGKVGYDE